MKPTCRQAWHGRMEGMDLGSGRQLGWHTLAG